MWFFLPQFYGSEHRLAWAVRARLPEWTPAAGRIGDRRSPRPASAYARMTIELLWSISAWGKGLRGARQGNIIASACPLYGMSPNLLIPVEHVTWWKGFLLGAIKKPDKPWKVGNRWEVVVYLLWSTGLEYIMWASLASWLLLWTPCHLLARLVPCDRI